MEDIKAQIVEKRLARMAVEGPELGHPVPLTRQVPLIPFDRDPFVICEVKRRSPSKGVFDAHMDACAQARSYVEAGVKTISVLTEEDYFGGSLSDLMDVKNAFPDTAVLRKDFLVNRQDIDVAYRAGADGVLLIASLLEPLVLKDLYEYAQSLGLGVFLEVHDRQDVERAKTVKPQFTGINSRDLTDFSIDRIIPLKTRRYIDWPTRLVFESGIFRTQEAAFASQAGFQGILVGEGVVKNPDLARQLVKDFRSTSALHPSAELSFWARLFERKIDPRPLVKICGLARPEDVELADSLGADLLGFVLAPSPRQTSEAFLRSLGPTRALKVGVVVLGPGEKVPAGVESLVNEGFLDALQFHGKEDPALVDAWGLRGYKALGYTGPEVIEPYQKTLSPRMLLDSVSAGQSGGTGTQISGAAFESLPASKLWLAGGLGPNNIAEVIKKLKPELVDASSALELSPGVKDPIKLKQYFEEIHRVSI